jgi:hypothetical protein
MGNASRTRVDARRSDRDDDLTGRRPRNVDGHDLVDVG